MDNANDIKTYQEHKNDIAQAIVNGIVERFGLNGTSKPVEPTPQPTPTPASKPSNYDQWVADLQNELNRQGFRDYEGKTLVVDGIDGKRTKSACPLVKKGAKGNITRLLQKRLVSVGFSLTIDGDFGTNTKEKVKKFQKNRGLDDDGEVGSKTWPYFLSGKSY
ncbi:MAG: peptidoglycan-binding protein [Coprobacillus sp.]|nr:peptidoglycan-binding protein [Coprobacillus sp.]